MKIIIRKKDFLEAIKNNEKNNQFIEYETKYGKSSFLKGTNKPTKKDWKVIPVPSIPKGAPFTRWTPRVTTEWYQTHGFDIEVSFKYDDLIKGPLKRFSEVKKIKTGEYQAVEEASLETPEPQEIKVAEEIKAQPKKPAPAEPKPEPKIKPKEELKKETPKAIEITEEPEHPKIEQHEISPFPPAVVFDNLVLASGQMPIDPRTGKLIRGTFEEETSAALKHLIYSLKISGSSEKKVLKLTVYVTDINQFEFLEDICDEFFAPNIPAFSCLEARRLPYDVQIQMDAVAYV